MQDGGIFFPSRLSTTFHTYFFSITYQSLYLLGIICTENLHPLDLDIDGTDSLEKTLNCFNPCFPGYLCRMVGYRRPITTFEIWHFGKLEFSNFWIFEFLNFWTIELLNFWIFEFLKFWIFEILNFWIFEFLNFWIF